MGQQSTETDGENYYSYTSQAVQDAINDANLSETAQMYDTLSEQLDNSNLNNYIEAAIDSSGTYIEILISGTFLFDSGKADSGDRETAEQEPGKRCLQSSFV